MSVAHEKVWRSIMAEETRESPRGQLALLTEVVGSVESAHERFLVAVRGAVGRVAADHEAGFASGLAELDRAAADIRRELQRARAEVRSVVAALDRLQLEDVGTNE
jgi:hypothetical protein